MDDDFNTPQLVAVLHDAARDANELLRQKKLARKPDVLAQLAAIKEFFKQQAEFTGVGGADPTEKLNEITDLLAKTYKLDRAQIDALIEERNTARAEKDWARADAIRDELDAKHIVLMDSDDGTHWRIQPPPVDA